MISRSEEDLKTGILKGRGDILERPDGYVIRTGGRKNADFREIDRDYKHGLRRST